MKFYAFSQWDGKPPMFDWISIEYMQMESNEHILKVAFFGFVLGIGWEN